jgi:hypothetical protein
MELAIIQSKIYELRGVRVMLDYDLAKMYGMETKQFKRSVRRNMERFEGEDFMFQLSAVEWNNLRSQIGTSSWGGNRYMPFAFTELGVAMLSSVLNSTVAIEVNRSIMRAFVAARKMFASKPVATLDDIEKLKSYIEGVIADQNDINEDTRLQLELINQSLAAMQTKEKPRRPIVYL